MEHHSKSYLYTALHERKGHFPLEGQLELTYRCNLTCRHCYCRGSEENGTMLSAGEYRDLLDQLCAAGCLWLVFTGGEPLLRPDFKEIYSYARQKGFIITLFSNGTLLDARMAAFLARRPPALVEVTLNGITEATYGAVTGVPQLLPKAVSGIRRLKKLGVPVIIKANLLRQNAHEIVKIKHFARTLFGAQRKGRFRFRYDMMVYARLNGDTSSCDCRPSFDDILAVHRRDPQMREGLGALLQGCTASARGSDRLYRCNSWKQQFVIDPFGLLKICTFTRSIVADLRKESFAGAFYRTLPALVEKRSAGRSVCRSCRLRYFCFTCPARAHLETGDERQPVEAFCVLARQMHDWTRQHQKGS